MSIIGYRDIAAIFKRVDAESVAVLDSHQDQLSRWLADYQQINIRLFQVCDILPLRFGMVVDREDEIEDFLAKSYIHLKWALDKLSNKAEFAVHVSWNTDAVLSEISNDEAWLKDANEYIESGDKFEIGKLLFESLDKMKKERVGCIHNKLIAVSLDSSEGKCVRDSMIMNRTYLIEKPKEYLFDTAMSELAHDGPSYLNIKYVGPIPPYSFAPLEFKRSNFDLVDDARRRLSLPERASFQEIKSSYRNLSLKYHPDKNPEDQRSSDRFRKLNEAYKILETYCVSYDSEGSLRSDIQYPFTKEEVEDVFIVERVLMR
jgi:hypothetical protein